MFHLLLRSLSLGAYLLLLFHFFSNWSNPYFHKKRAHRLIWVSVIGLVLIFSVLSDIFFTETNMPYVNLFLSIILIYAVAMLHHVSYLDSLIWAAILIAVNLICELLSLYLTKSIIPTKTTSYDTPSFTMIAVTITTLLGLIAIVLLKFFIAKEQDRNLSTNLSSTLFLIAVPILSIIILFERLLRDNSIGQRGFSETAITSSVIILNVCVIFLYKITIKNQKEYYQLSLTKKTIETEYKLLDEMKRNKDNVLKLKHDLKNQYILILGLIENNELEQATDYIKSSFDLLSPSMNTYTSDGVLNYLLNIKLAYAIENEISVDHQIFISKHLTLNNDVLAIVLGNVLDNAIQASLRISTEKRHLSIVIKQFNNDLILEVANNFDVTELTTRQHRKKEGLGMKNIDSLLKELGGIYKHWYENDRYFVTFVLFNVYQENT